MDAAKMTYPESSFDIVFSSNCFEHVSDFKSVINNCYRVLRKGGILFTIFGPIWSGPTGHHTYVWDDDTVITFQQKVFPDWLHLVFCERDLRKYLTGKYKSSVVNDICRCTYRGSNINRLCDCDYEDEIEKSDFKPIVSLRIKTSKRPNKDILTKLLKKYPQVKDFRTLGYFWILSKGRASSSKILRSYLLGGMRILIQKLFH